jgi:hypothetical protein
LGFGRFILYLHTYILLTDHIHDLAMRKTSDVTGGKSIAVRLQFISGISLFKPYMEERDRCYFILLSQTPHGTEAYRNKKHAM